MTRAEKRKLNKMISIKKLDLLMLKTVVPKKVR